MDFFSICLIVLRLKESGMKEHNVLMYETHINAMYLMWSQIDKLSSLIVLADRNLEAWDPPLPSAEDTLTSPGKIGTAFTIILICDFCAYLIMPRTKIMTCLIYLSLFGEQLMVMWIFIFTLRWRNATLTFTMRKCLLYFYFIEIEILSSKCSIFFRSVESECIAICDHATSGRDAHQEPSIRIEYIFIHQWQSSTVLRWYQYCSDIIWNNE